MRWDCKIKIKNILKVPPFLKCEKVNPTFMPNVSLVVHLSILTLCENYRKNIMTHYCFFFVIKKNEPSYNWNLDTKNACFFFLRINY